LIRLSDRAAHSSASGGRARRGQRAERRRTRRAAVGVAGRGHYYNGRAMLTFDLASCRLRPWRKQDLDALIRYANDREVWINLRERFPHPYTEGDAQRWLE